MGWINAVNRAHLFGPFTFSPFTTYCLLLITRIMPQRKGLLAEEMVMCFSQFSKS